MKKIVLVAVLATMVANACDTCVEAKVAKTRVDATFKELEIYKEAGMTKTKAFKDTMAEYKYWTNKVRKLEVQSEK